MMMMIRIKENRSLDDWGESFSRLTSKKETREFVCRRRKVDGWTLSCYAAVYWVSFLFLVLGARVLSQESSFGWFFSSVRPISCCRYVGNLLPGRRPQFGVDASLHIDIHAPIGASSSPIKRQENKRVSHQSRSLGSAADFAD